MSLIKKPSDGGVGGEEMRDKHVQDRNLVLSNKGLAIKAAIESGMLPEVDGGWDDSVFNVFWEKYENYLKQYRKSLSNKNGT